MASDPPSDTLAMCPRHPAEPLLGLACPECRGSAELCPVCLNDHAAAHPGHAIMAAASLRARIREAMSARLDGCSAHDGGAPLIACARHKAAAISAELEALSANEAAVLEDLRSHRHLLGAAFETRLAEVHNAAATKRVALQTEAVAADAALERACSTIDVVARAAETLDVAGLVAQTPVLLARLAAVHEAVAAVPVSPATSGFLGLARHAGGDGQLGEDLGPLVLAPLAPVPHYHTPHCPPACAIGEALPQGEDDVTGDDAPVQAAFVLAAADSPAPAAPVTGLSWAPAVPAAASAGGILSWAAVEGASAYRVQVATAALLYRYWKDLPPAAPSVALPASAPQAVTASAAAAACAPPAPAAAPGGAAVEAPAQSPVTSVAAAATLPTPPPGLDVPALLCYATSTATAGLLPPGTTLYARVAAVTLCAAAAAASPGSGGGGGVVAKAGPWSDPPLQFTTAAADARAPAALPEARGLRAAVRGADAAQQLPAYSFRVPLSWEPVAGADAYAVEWGTHSALGAWTGAAHVVPDAAQGLLPGGAWAPVPALGLGAGAGSDDDAAAAAAAAARPPAAFAAWELPPHVHFSPAATLVFDSRAVPPGTQLVFRVQPLALRAPPPSLLTAAAAAGGVAATAAAASAGGAAVVVVGPWARSAPFATATESQELASLAAQLRAERAEAAARLAEAAARERAAEVTAAVLARSLDAQRASSAAVAERLAALLRERSALAADVGL